MDKARATFGSVRAKYSIGDTLWRVNIKDVNPGPCPRCKGNRSRTIGIVQKVYVSRVELNVDEAYGVRVLYRLRHYNGSRLTAYKAWSNAVLKENELFSTKAEAEAALKAERRQDARRRAAQGKARKN